MTEAVDASAWMEGGKGMRSWMTVWGLLCLLLVAGCDESRLIAAFGSPADEKVAAHYIELLRKRDYAAIEKDLDPSIKAPGVHDALVAMASLVPAQAPLSVKVVGVRTSDGGGVHSSNYTYEYEYPDRWLLINAAVKKEDGATTIIGLNVKPLDSSLEAMNRFSLAGKNVLHYAVLGAAVLVPLLCLYALVACVRTPMRGRKWPWILFILFGMCSLSLNWTSGGWEFHPVSFLLLGAGVIRSPYGPWMLSVAFPLGAVWFLLKRKEYLQRAARELAPVDGKDGGEGEPCVRPDST